MSSLDVRALGTKDQEKDLGTKPAPKAKQEFRIFVAEGAFDHVVERGAADVSREVGGILVGEALRDESGPYVRIDASIDALHAEEKGAELTFTHATWEHINKELDTKYEGKRVVGWWHTHPGFGVFLSDRDQFIHRSFFNLPFQIALVYDPKTREHGVFTWRDNEPWRARRYFLGEREHTWDAPRVTPGKENVEAKTAKSAKERVDESDDDEGVKRRASAAADAQPQTDWTVIAMAAGFALLVGGFLGYWIGGRGGGGAETGGMKQQDLVRLVQDSNRETAAQINMNLLAILPVLRETLTEESDRKALVDALAALDLAKQSLEPQLAANPALKDTLAKLDESRKSVEAALESRNRAAEAIDNIERASRGSISPKEIQRVFLAMSHNMGDMYATLGELTWKDDPKRGFSYFQKAVMVDPDGLARYEGRLQRLQKDLKLKPEAPPEQPKASPSPPASPSPAASPSASPSPSPSPSPATKVNP